MLQRGTDLIAPKGQDSIAQVEGLGNGREKTPSGLKGRDSYHGDREGYAILLRSGWENRARGVVRSCARIHLDAPWRMAECDRRAVAGAGGRVAALQALRAVGWAP